MLFSPAWLIRKNVGFCSWCNLHLVTRRMLFSLIRPIWRREGRLLICWFSSLFHCLSQLSYGIRVKTAYTSLRYLLCGCFRWTLNLLLSHVLRIDSVQMSCTTQFHLTVLFCTEICFQIISGCYGQEFHFPEWCALSSDLFWNGQESLDFLFCTEICFQIISGCYGQEFHFPEWCALSSDLFWNGQESLDHVTGLRNYPGFKDSVWNPPKLVTHVAIMNSHILGCIVIYTQAQKGAIYSHSAMDL